MRALIVLIAMFVTATISPAADEEKRHRTYVPGTRITLEARKAKYCLGESILLDYRISYDGDGALDVGTITGLGSPDCTVVAIDEDGNKAPTSTRVFHSTGASGRVLRRGGSVRFTIPLGHYCRLEKQGKYRIRAAHNLHWTQWGVTIAKDDPRWAEATIEVRMPDEAEARQVIEEMLMRNKDVKRYQGAYCTWNTGNYSDFACLGYPVYLPILEKMAAGKHGDTQALLGIAHNPSPEATRVFLRLLKTANSDRRRWIAGALCDRLPEPKGVKRRDRRNPFAFEDADPKLVKHSWRGEFAATVRRFAREWLVDDDPVTVQCAAYTLEAIGVSEDMPDLAAALSRLVPIVEKARPEYVWEIPPVRQACNGATHAILAMAARRVDPKAHPRTPGEVIHFVSAIEQRKDFRPGGWEKRYRNWVRKASPYVRDYVLFHAPRPLPRSLIATFRDEIRNAITTTRGRTTIRLAARMAVELDVPLDEILARLVDRLDSGERQLYVDVIWSLQNLVQTGKHDRPLQVCMPIPGEKGMAVLKTRWKQFLQQHGEAIRNGKHFDLNSAEYHRLLSGARE
jgi:hypothetical protein